MPRADSKSSPSDRPPRRGAGDRTGQGRPGPERGAPRRPDTGRPAGGGGAGRPAAEGPLFIYGRNPVREALRGRRAVLRILLVAGPVGDELEQNLASWTAGRPKPQLRRLAALELTEALGTGDHQGIAAEVAPYPYVEPAALLRKHTLLIALDEVQDPHNLGAIIRTATAAGAGVVIPRHRAAEITGAVVKASAGTTERAAVAQVRNLADFLTQAKAAGYWIYGASGSADSGYTAQDYSYPTCFVMGSEGEGLGRRVESMCDVLVSIPLGGGVESLNVSVSAGILLYEAVRQRGAVLAAGGAAQPTEGPAE
jgi:23S rRNA (guanosine2251-2'-O)-methyltransferase